MYPKINVIKVRFEAKPENTSWFYEKIYKQLPNFFRIKIFHTFPFSYIWVILEKSFPKYKFRGWIFTQVLNTNIFMEMKKN